MSLFKCHPVGQGKHQNVHLLVQDKSKSITFKVVAFLETNHAYIVRHSTKLNTLLLDADIVRAELLLAISKYDYKLMTPLEELYLCHNSTVDVLEHFKMLNAYIDA